MSTTIESQATANEAKAEYARDNFDKINPSHYKTPSGLEAIDVIEKFELPYHVATAVRYLLRAGKKVNESESDDLQKARWYIERRLMQLRMLK